MGFPDSSVGKESTCNAGDSGLIPGSRRTAGEGIGYALQYSWASFVAQLVKNPPAMQETWVQSLGGKILWRRERLPTPVFWPGEFHRLYSPWGCKKSDTTGQISLFTLFAHFCFSFNRYDSISWEPINLFHSEDLQLCILKTRAWSFSLTCWNS